VSLDAHVHATAIKAALSSMTATVYEYDNVPGTNGNPGSVPARFLILAVERRFGGLLRSGRTSTSGWRFSLRGVAGNVESVRMMLAEAAALVNETRLTIGGGTTTPIQFESGEAPVFDDGDYSGHDFYTYAL
jgi:hypothetical protein